MEKLKQFFGAYFHQDWRAEISDPDDVVHLFVRDRNSMHELRHLAEEIEQYADEKKDDAFAEEGLLRELGCYYMPSADGVGARSWLQHVAKLLRSADGLGL